MSARSRRVRAAGVLAGALLVASAFMSCGTARRSEALDGPMAIDSAEIARGRVVFYDRCHKCHPGGEAGLGPDLNDKPLPKFLMRLQVRQGLGAMPRFAEREISDDDLDALLAYVVARRRS